MIINTNILYQNKSDVGGIAMKKMAIFTVLIGLTLTLGACSSNSSSSKDSSSSEKTSKVAKKKESKSSSSSKSMAPSEATDLTKTTEYLKQNSVTKDYFKSVTQVDGVLTIELQNINYFAGSLGAVRVRRLSEIMGAANKLPLAKNGVGLVQSNEYSDNSGNKKDLMEFSVYYSRSSLDKINFTEFPSIIQHTPTGFFTGADGYYLMTEFIKQDKNVLESIDQMKADDKNLIVAYMDKYGTDY